MRSTYTHTHTLTNTHARTVSRSPDSASSKFLPPSWCFWNEYILCSNWSTHTHTQEHKHTRMHTRTLTHAHTHTHVCGLLFDANLLCHCAPLIRSRLPPSSASGRIVSRLFHFPSLFLSLSLPSVSSILSFFHPPSLHVFQIGRAHV